MIDHDYAVARHLVWARIDTFVWLDYSRAVCEWRVIRRSVPRALLRRELWNGNRESLRNLLSRDADQNVVLWSWRKHAELAARYERAMVDPSWSRMHFVRVRDDRDVARLFAVVGSMPRGDSVEPPGSPGG